MKNKEPDKSAYRPRISSYLLVCVSIIAFLVYVDPATAHENDDGSAVVHVTDKGFEPESVEIRAGDTIVFENVDQQAHWPASDPHPMHTNYPEFDPQKPIEPNTEWSFAFDKPGEWTYHDHQNPYLKGEIIVLSDEESGTSSAGDRAGDRSRAGSFLASITAFFLNVYEATMPFASEEEEPASDDADVRELSREQYEKVKDRYVALVRDQGPKVALNQLKDEIETNDALSRSCHPLAHEIGRETHKKYQDFSEAMKYQDEVCNSGYIHGVIESRFSESDDVFADMRTMCGQYPLGSFLSSQCYHGIGHGAMYYTANDLPRSLEMCDAFSSSLARANCSNGVFMENFNTDQKLHLSEHLKESDPFYPCAEQASHHKKNCYLYAPTYFLSLNKGDYAGALEWCNGAENPYKPTCALGVGAQTIKENIDDPKQVESICMGGGSEQVEPCIEGMMDLYASYHGSPEPVRALCDLLEISNRQTCYDWVESNSELFSA